MKTKKITTILSLLILAVFTISATGCSEVEASSSKTITQNATATTVSGAIYSYDDMFSNRDMKQEADLSEAQYMTVQSGEDITEGANIIVGPNGQEYHSYNAPGAATRMPTGAKLAIGLGAPCLIALGVCATFKAQMKTAKEKTTAEEYVVPGSAALRVRDDHFINRTETRVPIHTESSSGRGGSSGGSSFHSGGGFSGSSGKF